MTTPTQEMPRSTAGLYRYHDVIGLLSAGGPGFSGPVSLALGPDGLLYVASRANPNQPEAVRVTRCTRDGDYVDQFGHWGEEPGQFTWVTAIAFNRRGELFLSDEHTNRISVFDTQGRFLRYFAPPGGAEFQLNRPSDIAFDMQDNLYVVDSLNHRVRVYDQHGQSLAGWGGYGGGEGQFSFPWGVALDAGGNVFVTDWRNDRVQKFTADGKFLLSFGSPGEGPGQFNRPTGITVDADGDVYVCDWMNDRVQVFDSRGGYKDSLIGHSGVSRWARTFLDANPDIEEKLELATQNIELKQRFYRPRSVLVDEDGLVYVADCYRHRVQIYAKLAA